MYKNNQVNSFQPETEHYFEILKYSKIIFYLIEHKIKSYSPLHWSEARLNSIKSNHVLKKFRHCELRATVIFLWCCIFHICICDLIFLLHLLTSHRKLKGLWIFGEPLWTLDPSEKSNEMAATKTKKQKPCSTWSFYFQSWKQFLTVLLSYQLYLQ